MKKSDLYPLPLNMGRDVTALINRREQKWYSMISEVKSQKPMQFLLNLLEFSLLMLPFGMLPFRTSHEKHNTHREAMCMCTCQQLQLSATFASSWSTYQTYEWRNLQIIPAPIHLSHCSAIWEFLAESPDLVHQRQTIPVVSFWIPDPQLLFYPTFWGVLFCSNKWLEMVVHKW